MCINSALFEGQSLTTEKRNTHFRRNPEVISLQHAVVSILGVTQSVNYVLRQRFPFSAVLEAKSGLHTFQVVAPFRNVVRNPTGLAKEQRAVFIEGKA